MNASNLTWASIIPLIGGESIGVMNTLDGKLPEYILSYPPFKHNDAHFIEYIKNKGWDDSKYYMIDPVTNTCDNIDSVHYVDIVNSVPPCAGLSSLNKDSGHGCPVNDWMYISTEFALKHIKPKVLFGENAPRLSSATGALVRDNLAQIGKRYGYSVAFYRTASYKHGCPQKRLRTFFFLFKSECVPFLEFYNRPLVSFGTQIDGPLHSNDPMNVPAATSKCHLGYNRKPSDVLFYRYVLDKIENKTHREFLESLEKSTGILDYILANDGNFNNFIEWCNGHRNPEYEYEFNYAIKKAQHMNMKMASDLGYWNHHIKMVPYHGIAPAYVSSAPYNLVHPLEDRFLTLREGLRLMGLPDDFNVIGGAKNTNHICQNVPVATAQDMAEQAVKFIIGELHISVYDRMIVNNINDTYNLDGVGKTPIQVDARSTDLTKFCL